MTRSFVFKRRAASSITELMLRATEKSPPSARRKPTGLVTCIACRKEQTDRGQRATCIKCGISPIPSRAYPEGNFFCWPPDDALQGGAGANEPILASVPTDDSVGGTNDSVGGTETMSDEERWHREYIGAVPQDEGPVEGDPSRWGRRSLDP